MEEMSLSRQIEAPGPPLVDSQSDQLEWGHESGAEQAGLLLPSNLDIFRIGLSTLYPVILSEHGRAVARM